MNREQIDKLGKFLIENIRDLNIDAFDRLAGNTSGLTHPTLTWKVRDSFTKQELYLIRKIVIECIDTTVDELLHNLDKENNESDVSICVEDINISREDDYLRKELYSDDGWIARFSRHYDEDDV